MTKSILVLALSAAVACSADVIYSNADPASDQQTSVFYSTGYTQLGDQIHMTSAGTLTSVDAQFFNVGSDATFDAVLSFYQVGSPVGAQIGGSFLATNAFIAGGTSQTVTFSNLGGILIPADVIVTLAVENVSAGGDIGVNFFDPPTVGTSDDTFFIANDGTGLAQASTNLDIDNIYLVANSGAAVPEPATAGAVALCLAVLVRFRYGRHGKSQ
ncbi:MAG TPA: hypothetical protein VGL53_30735 [Bryobacteraceae bacterium]|jgi:hypothetical protein